MPGANPPLRPSRGTGAPARIVALSVVACAAATAVVASGAAAAPSPEARASAVLAANRFQRQLPTRPDPELPGWLLSILTWLADLSNLLLVIFAAVALCVFVYAALRWWEARRAAAPAKAAAAGPHGDRSAAGDLTEAETLAAAGHYDEAVHLLLFAAIDRVFGAAGRRPSRAATSRELVRLVPGGGTTGAAFAAIVALVERSLFGGKALTREDWDSGRAQWSAMERNP